ETLSGPRHRSLRTGHMGNTFRLLGREVWMPWKASSVMEERLRFVARLLDGEAMTDVCQDFGISRKTGYKIFDRYREHGLAALTDRSRRPVRYANQLPQQVESLIVRLKADKPHWGARKIRELLVRRLDGDIRVPAKSTIHAVLDRHGLVKRGGGPRHRARGTPLSEGARPNDLWCADFKGEFKLGNGRYCYPLTVTDHASRFLLLCEALESTREDTACTAFERLFRERGLPLAIRSDNGVPFASPNALFNLSKLSVWWLRLGIAIERIKPVTDKTIAQLPNPNDGWYLARWRRTRRSGYSHVRTTLWVAWETFDHSIPDPRSSSRSGGVRTSQFPTQTSPL